MSDVGQQLSANDSRRIAWERWKQHPDYAPAARWARDPLSVDGSMWRSFLEGYTAAAAIARSTAETLAQERQQKLRQGRAAAVVETDAARTSVISMRAERDALAGQIARLRDYIAHRPSCVTALCPAWACSCGFDALETDTRALAPNETAKGNHGWIQLPAFLASQGDDTMTTELQSLRTLRETAGMYCEQLPTEVREALHRVVGVEKHHSCAGQGAQGRPAALSTCVKCGTPTQASAVWTICDECLAAQSSGAPVTYAGRNPDDHIRETTTMITVGKGALRKTDDTREDSQIARAEDWPETAHIAALQRVVDAARAFRLCADGGAGWYGVPQRYYQELFDALDETEGK